MAGAYVGFGGWFATSITFDIAPELGIAFKKMLAGGAFSIGLMLVIIAGAELFTGNTLMISSIITGRITWKNTLTRWTVVWIANFIGSIIVTLLFYYSGLWRTGGDALGLASVTVP